jgi:hypothetical protein
MNLVVCLGRLFRWVALILPVVVALGLYQVLSLLMAWGLCSGLGSLPCSASMFAPSQWCISLSLNTTIVACLLAQVWFISFVHQCCTSTDAVDEQEIDSASEQSHTNELDVENAETEMAQPQWSSEGALERKDRAASLYCFWWVVGFVGWVAIVLTGVWACLTIDRSLQNVFFGRNEWQFAVIGYIFGQTILLLALGAFTFIYFDSCFWPSYRLLLRRPHDSKEDDAHLKTTTQ